MISKNQQVYEIELTIAEFILLFLQMDCLLTSSHIYVKQSTGVLSSFPLVCFCVVTEATVILQMLCLAMFCFCVSVCIDLRKLTLRKYSCMQNWSNLCCNEPLSEYNLTQPHPWHKSKHSLCTFRTDNTVCNCLQIQNLKNSEYSRFQKFHVTS